MRIVTELAFAFGVFAISVILCAASGGLIGWFIAKTYPKYYPSVFASASTQPDFDPVEVGIGTGIGQGAAAGLLVGAVIVLALAIRTRRRDGGAKNLPD
jgi:hypothetical protein